MLYIGKIKKRYINQVSAFKSKKPHISNMAKNCLHCNNSINTIGDIVDILKIRSTHEFFGGIVYFQRTIESWG